MQDEPTSYKVTYCLNTSPTRLFMGRAGLKLLYHGILVTPGQLLSSGVPHSSNILFSCSGCIHGTKLHFFTSRVPENYNHEFSCRTTNCSSKQNNPIAFLVFFLTTYVISVNSQVKKEEASSPLFQSRNTA